MCSGSSPGRAARLPEAPTPPASADSTTATSNNRRRRAASSGTVLTGSGGVGTNAPTQQKTLLGA